jgi:hypothetical protein
MNENCGCCEGTEKLTPVSIANRPGLSALAYRTGAHGSFLETMKARLSTLGITHADMGLPLNKPDEQDTPTYPLQGLTTRSADDPAIAMLDAWATVADVLTFYQERIANEGYLRTATERRSILELARLVGYNLRPGVSASVYLAYTLEDGAAETTIPAGSRSQSLPGAGEQPQSFETSDPLFARAAWNNLQPRLTRPQFITQENADFIDTLYFQGVSTNLKPNDPILLVFDRNTKPPGTTHPGQFVRFVKAVEPQVAEKRTKVTLQVILTVDSFGRAVQQTVERYLDLQTFCVSSGNKLINDVVANQLTNDVVDILNNLLSDVTQLEKGPNLNLDTLVQKLTFYLDGSLTDNQPGLKNELDEAASKKFAILATWLNALVADLEKILIWVPPSPKNTGTAMQPLSEMPIQALPVPSLNGFSTLVDIPSLIAPLVKPASLQPPNSQRLGRDPGQTFAARSDIYTQLLTVLNPTLETATLYSAIAAAPVTRLSDLKSTQAFSVKAAPFGHNAPLKPNFDKNGKVIDQEEWPLNGAVTFGAAIFLVPPIPIMSLSTTPPPDSDNTASVEASPQSSAGGTQLGELTLNGGQISIARDGSTESKTISFDQLSQTSSLDGFSVTITITPVTPHSDSVSSIVFDFTDSSQHIHQSIKVTPQPKAGGKQVVGVQLNDTETRQDVSSGEQKGYSTKEHNVNVGFDTQSNSISVTDEVFTPVPPEQRTVLALDGEFDQIIPGSWVIIERPDRTDPTKNEQIINKVLKTETVSLPDYGITGTVTRLTLEQPWLGDKDVALATLRQVTVYAQSEQRDLNDETIDPIVESVCGNTIELDRLYDGLQSGRWLIVTGERTDTFVTGTIGTEIVMLSGVTQGVHQVSVSSTGSQMASGNGQTAQGDGPLAPGNELISLGDGQKTAGDGKMTMGGNQQLVNTTKKIDLPGDKTHTFITLANDLSFTYKRDTVTIYGNVVQATNGETRVEVLGSGDGTKKLQQFQLRKSPLTYVPAPNAAGITSTLQVRVNNILWHETDNLAAAHPTDRTYITQEDDKSQTSVVFGNGEHGARLPTGVENVKAVYRFGIGTPGNVKAKQINQLSSRPLGVKGVINPKPATGGADAESRDQARRNVPLAVQALDRLVSVEDYADFAHIFAGIGKASSARLSDGHRQLVHLTIAGANNIPIDVNSDLFQNLFQALRQQGDPFVPLQVDLCEVLMLVISANVRLLPDYEWEPVEPVLRAAVLDAFSFERRELGQSVFQSELISIIQGVAGVDYVNLEIMGVVGEDKILAAINKATLNPADPDKEDKETEDKETDETGEIAKEELAEEFLELLALTGHHDIPVRLARINPNSKTLADRILPAQLAFLSPDVPDTLILNPLP